MSSPLYLIGIAFLGTTSLLFLLWHCTRSRRLREQAHDLESEGSGGLDSPTLLALAGINFFSRGVPPSLIRSLPTHVFLSISKGSKVRGQRKRS